MRWQFFADLLERFTQAVEPQCPAAFETDLRHRLSAFTGVWIVDGSCLDRIAHRLEVLRDEPSVVLPGSLLGIYDLFRGFPRRLLFSEQAKRGEVPQLKQVLDDVPAGTLLVADRAYCSHKLMGELTSRDIAGLVRCSKAIGLQHLEPLGRRRHQGGTLEESLVRAGTPQKKEQQQTLRLVVWTKGKKTVRLLTNVLDPAELSAVDALALYQRRWAIERMFYDLKEVLDLHSFYAANVNAVAMQVHAAALVYVALRVAQARIAQQVELPPEKLSVPKLFPRIAAAHFCLVSARLTFLAVQQANPAVQLREPVWTEQDFAWVSLDVVRVEPRTARRRTWKRPNGQHASLHRFTKPKKDDR